MQPLTARTPSFNIHEIDSGWQRTDSPCRGLNLKRDLQERCSSLCFKKMKGLNLCPTTFLWLITTPDRIVRVSDHSRVPSHKYAALTSEIMAGSRAEKRQMLCSRLDMSGHNRRIISRGFEDLKLLVRGSLERSSRKERLSRVISKVFTVWISTLLRS